MTRHKWQERELTRSEERYRGITERSFDGIITLSPEACITYISPSAKRIFSYEAAEMTGKPPRRLLP